MISLIHPAAGSIAPAFTFLAKVVRHSKANNKELGRRVIRKFYLFSILFIFQANGYFQQGDLQQGHRYQTRAIITMVLTVMMGIVSGLVIYYIVKSQY